MKRKRDGKAAALSQLAFYLHRTFMQGHDLPDHGKPKSKPGISFPGRIYLVKTLPDLINMLWIDPDPVVFYFQDSIAAFCGKARPYMAVFFAVFSGVFQEIDDHS